MRTNTTSSPIANVRALSDRVASVACTNFRATVTQDGAHARLMFWCRSHLVRDTSILWPDEPRKFAVLVRYARVIVSRFARLERQLTDLMVAA